LKVPTDAERLPKFETAVRNLNLDGRGLEIAPYFNPLLRKPEYDVLYTDYLDTEALRVRAAKNPGVAGREIAPVDFVWIPGKRLRDCSPVADFDYVLASHVIEHVPNPIGWLNQILEVVKVGGIVSLLVPDRRASNDYYRAETSLAELIACFLEDSAVPSPRQIADFAFCSVDGSGWATRSFETGVPFEEAPRPWTDGEALGLVFQVHSEREYLDAHCTVWTAPQFASLMRRVSNLGLINVDVSAPVEDYDQFYVQLTKRGEPSVMRPPSRAEQDCETPAIARLRDRISALHHELGVLRNEVGVVRNEARHEIGVLRHETGVLRNERRHEIGALRHDLGFAIQLIDRVVRQQETMLASRLSRLPRRFVKTVKNAFFNRAGSPSQVAGATGRSPAATTGSDPSYGSGRRRGEG